MVIALPLLLLGSGLSLSLEVPPELRTGREVVATIWVENKSSAPLVCVIPSGPNASLGVIWKSSLRRGSAALVRDEAGPFMGQWMHQEVIRTEPFLVLKPGERASLYQEKFKVIFPDGVKPSLISEYSKAKRAPLEPGEYTLSFRYGFDRTFKETKRDLTTYEMAQKLSAPARALYERTWTGAVDVSARFKVTE